MTFELPQLSGAFLAGGLLFGLIAVALLIADGALPAHFALLRGSLEEMGPHVRIFLVGNILWASAWASVLVGFVVLAHLLADAGDRYLAKLSLIAITVAVVLALLEATFGLTVTRWAITEAVANGTTPEIYTVLRGWTNGLQAVYILFALAAQAGFGAALLQTGLVSSGVSWFTLIWSLGWLFVLALGIPAILMIAPAVIGVALLFT